LFFNPPAPRKTGFFLFFVLAFDLQYYLAIFQIRFSRRLIMAEDNSTGSNFIWAVTLIIIVAIIAGALYYSGFLGGTKKEQIDINVTAPASR
jgi:hypothetical protein